MTDFHAMLAAIKYGDGDAYQAAMQRMARGCDELR